MEFRRISITIPQRNNIRCMICRIRVQPEDYAMIDYAYHRNIINCRPSSRKEISTFRLFLQNAPEAMAAPISDQELCKNDGSLYVIFTKDFFEDPTFQDQCVDLNIEVMKQLDPIPTSVFENCLRHTIEYKLAPQWNKVGLYLVEGQEFLSSTTEYVNAIQLSIENIRDNVAQFQVQALKLRIPFLRLTANLQPTEVYVLPRLSKAYVRQRWDQIQERHLFRNYEHLRAYWQNVHGYILPDYEEGLSFYDVQFFPSGNVYVYPKTCLTSGLLEVIPPDNPTFIYRRFAEDLERRVPRLCEQQLNPII